MTITDEEFNSIVTFMRSNYGINLQAKKVLITGRLENYLIRNGFRNYKEYIQRVMSDKSGKEAKTLIDYLTTNHTYFWREPVHFDFLKKVALPKLAEKEMRSKDLRIWSAASSTGEEAYTLVMVLKEFFRTRQGDWDTRILATDISQKALEKARRGVYLAEQLNSVPQTMRKTYFDRLSQDEYRVKQQFLQEVSFRPFNLMDAFTFRYKFHIIFLRNVMIYFEEDTKQKLVDKMYQVMEPGGYLFIGTTEIINKDASKFKYVQPSIYQK